MAGSPLLVIAKKIGSDALLTRGNNRVRGVIKTCAVKAPGFGDRRKALVQDIATPPGGSVMTDELRSAFHAPTLDEDSGVKIVMRALEEPLHRFVIHAADEPSIVLHRVDESADRALGYNAATREYGDLLIMG
jgi:chaperonin GroEL (HSP60 family)